MPLITPKAPKNHSRARKRLRFSFPGFSKSFLGWQSFSKSRKSLGLGLKELFNAKGSFAHKLCLILGLISIAGFLLDITAVALPLQPFEAAWRLELIRAVADRFLVLLLGLALLALALQNNSYLKKPFSRFCLFLGIIFLVLPILVFQSVHSLRETAKISIGQQRSQALEQIQSLQTNPSPEASALTPEQITTAKAQINQQAETLQQNTVRNLYRSLFVITGNLILVSVGSIALSRLLSS